MVNNLFNLSILLGFYFCRVILKGLNYFLQFVKILCFTLTVFDSSNSLYAIYASIYLISIFLTPEVIPPLLLVIISNFSSNNTYGISTVPFSNRFQKNTIKTRKNAHIFKESTFGNFNISQPVNAMIFSILDSANFFDSFRRYYWNKLFT